MGDVIAFGAAAAFFIPLALFLLASIVLLPSLIGAMRKEARVAVRVNARVNDLRQRNRY